MLGAQRGQTGASQRGGWVPARREARLLAGAIDLVVVALLGALCALVALAAMLAQVDPFESDPTFGQWLVGYAVAALWFPAAVLYIALAGLRGGTLGARSLGLRVDASPARILARALLWWPGWFALAALWWPWLDPQGRGPVDRLTGTWLLEPAETAHAVAQVAVPPAARTETAAP